MAFDLPQYVDCIQRLVESQTPFVIATLISMRGSAPQIVGAKAVVTAQGIVAGTVGGGKIEARAVRYAQKLLERFEGRTNDLVTWNLQTDVGMTCGGEVQLYFEVCADSPWTVAVFGAGHVAQTLVPMLTQLNCHVVCYDPRQEWIDRLPDHLNLSKICVADLSKHVRDLPANAFFLLMTQGHATDLPVLAEILSTRQAPYIGVIGSLQKAKVVRRELSERGFSDDQINSYLCPIGLPLGNNTPAEISISVIAQLIQTRDRLGIVQHKTKQFSGGTGDAS